jgi:hypothetical protein
VIDGYEDIPCHGLRDEWLRDVPPEWQRTLMGVESRLRVIRSQRTGQYLVVMRQSDEEPLHIEKFDDGEYLVRWIPIQWMPSRANCRWFVENIQRAAFKFRQEFGADPSPKKIHDALQARHKRQAEKMKAETDGALREATKEAMNDMGTQRVTSIEGVKPGASYWKKPEGSDVIVPA